MALIHETPGKLFESQTTWFKKFTNRNLICATLAAVPVLPVFFICKSTGHMLIGLFVMVAALATGYLLSAFRLSNDKHFYDGGGLYPYEILIRRLYRHRKKETYIKNFNRFSNEGDFYGEHD